VITKPHRQEGLCRAYVQAIAAQAGLISSRPDPDYGIDLSLRSVESGEGRHLDSSVQVDLQLRSTTRAHKTDSEIKIDLDVDTYNYLRNLDVFCPRLLIVLVMPVDESQWLEQSVNELTLRHCAYWLSLSGQPSTTAISSIRVGIPLTNVFSVEAVRSLLQRIRERKAP
jgi:hypothetical protein